MRRLLPLALAFLPVLAPAQTGRHLPALETYVAVADRAFTGRVVKVDITTFRTTPDGPDHREHRLPDSLLYRYTLTIRVELNVRGGGEDTVRLRFESDGSSPVEKTWIDQKKSYCWSIIPIDRVSASLRYDMRSNRLEEGPGGWMSLDLDHLMDDGRGSDGRYRLPLFSENLDVVRSREEAIFRLEAFARAHPKPLHP